MLHNTTPHARILQPTTNTTHKMASIVARRAAFTATTAARPAAGARRMTTVVRAEAGPINPAIKKDVDKVVDTLKASELGKKAVMCRCWRSEKFPFCDGAHAKHNAATGDNVGPLIIDLSQ